VKKQKAIEIRLSALIFDGALQTGTAPARLPAQLQGAQAETEQGSDGVYRRYHSRRIEHTIENEGRALNSRCAQQQCQS